MASFLQSAGVALFAALLAACWHALSRNEKPEAQELAVGVDLLVSAMVLVTGFIPGSHGSDLGLRWAGLVLLFAMLTAMALFTKMFGYKDSENLYRKVKQGSRSPYVKVEQMTGTAAWLTSIVGSVTLCVFWWLNMNIGLVDTVWREALR